MGYPTPEPSQGFLSSFMNSLAQNSPNLSNTMMKIGDQKRAQAKDLYGEIKKQQELQKKIKEKSYKDLDSVANFYKTKLKPKEKEEILPLFTEAQLAGRPPEEAYNQALEKHQMQRQLAKEQRKQQFMEQRLNAFEKRSPINTIRKRVTETPFNQRLNEMRNQRQEAFKTGPSIVKEPIEALTGISESPVANLLSTFSNPEMGAARFLKEGGSSIFTPAFKSPPATSERGRKTRELTKELTDFALLSTPVAGKIIGEAGSSIIKSFNRSKIGNQFSNLLKKYVEKVGEKKAAEAFKKTVDELKTKPEFFKGNINTGEGVWSEEGVNAFYKNYRGKVSGKEPSISSGRFLEEEGYRFQQQPKQYRKGEKISPKSKNPTDVIERQMKEGKKPSIKKAAQEETTRHTKAKEAKIINENIQDRAKQELDGAKKNYLEVTRTRRRVEDSLSRGEKTHTKKELERVKGIEQESKENLKKISYEARSGRKYSLGEESKKAAHTAIKKVEEIASDLSIPIDEKVLSPKGSLKPDTIKLYEKSVNTTSKLPGEGNPTTNTKILKDYADAYMKKLDEVTKAIKDGEFYGIEGLAKNNRMKEILESRLKTNFLKQRMSLGRDKLRQIHKRLKYLDSNRYEAMNALAKKPETAAKVMNLLKKDINSKEAKVVLDLVPKESREKFVKFMKAYFTQRRSPVGHNLLNKVGIKPYSRLGRMVRGFVRGSLASVGIVAPGTIVYRTLRKFSKGSGGESLSKRQRRRSA
jgi:hypothetical protein